MINSSEIRDFFPSIVRADHNNNQIIYFDGPGGTQVPIQVIEAISQYYIRSNANTHGEFITCLLYTSPSPRDISGSRMPSSA